MRPLYSLHSQRRMQEMDVGFEEVRGVLDDPAATYPGSPEYGAGASGPRSKDEDSS